LCSFGNKHKLRGYDLVSTYQRLIKWLNTLTFLTLGYSEIFLYSAHAQEEPLPPVNFAITAVAFKSDVQMLQGWRHYLEKTLGRQVNILQRSSYEEIMHLLKTKKADFAWICGYPYVKEKKNLILVATPLYKGKPLYHSVLIINRNNLKPIKNIFDLEHSILAYSDPLSNSGYLYPSYLLAKWGEQPDQFFKLLIRTYAHENSIKAVSSGLADAAFVDSYVLDVMRQKDTKVTDRIKVVTQSPLFGFPPIVASNSVSPKLIKDFRQALLKMPTSSGGKEVLKALVLDGFVVPSLSLYHSIEQMKHFVEGNVYQ